MEKSPPAARLYQPPYHPRTSRTPPRYAPLTRTTPHQTKTPAKAAAAAAASYAALKEKRAWDLAISPAKSLPMQAFMLYMSGGGVQIFSMGIVLMLLLTPIKNMAGMNAGESPPGSSCYVRLTAPVTAFAPFSPTQTPTPTALPLQKLTYILCNLLTLVVGLWKCRSMGLLPTGTGDWLAFESRGVVRVPSLRFSLACSVRLVPPFSASGDIAPVNAGASGMTAYFPLCALRMHKIHPVPCAIFYTREHDAYYEPKGYMIQTILVLSLAQESSMRCSVIITGNMKRGDEE